MPLTQVQGGMLAGSTNTTTTIQSNGTTAITIDSSQNVGIGVTSPTGKLAIDATNSNTPRIVFKNPSANGDAAISTFGSSTGTDVILGSNAYINSSGNFARFDAAQAGSYVYANRTGLLLFGTNTSSGVATERMRIDSAGRALFGSTDTNPAVNNNPGVAINANADNSFYAGVIQASATGNAALFLNRGGDDGATVSFRRSGTFVGFISVTTSSTSYNTSSDYRLKENIAPMTGALAKVAQLKPCTYTWKATGETGEGFIAHELQAVVPNAVTGEKDAVDKDGNPEYQGVDTSFLVATLTAAIQELKAELDATKAEVAALKAAP